MSTDGVTGTAVLVRHARPYPPRPGGPDDFHRGLTAEGLAQAEQLPALLAEVRAQAVVSSPYLRAVQIVEPTARLLGLPVQTLTRAVAAITILMARHQDATVMIGGHGTFIARTLVGLGIPVDWAFCQAVPMPAVYQIRFNAHQLHVTGPGLADTR